MYIGKDCAPSLLLNLFNKPALSQIDTFQYVELDNPHSRQVSTFINYLKSIRPRFMQLVIIRQDIDSIEKFNNMMVEDANFDNSSYVDYLVSCHRNIQADISGK
jgi:protein transport protein SEC24